MWNYPQGLPLSPFKHISLNACHLRFNRFVGDYGLESSFSVALWRTRGFWYLSFCHQSYWWQRVWETTEESQPFVHRSLACFLRSNIYYSKVNWWVQCNTIFSKKKKENRLLYCKIVVAAKSTRVLSTPYKSIKNKNNLTNHFGAKVLGEI